MQDYATAFTNSSGAFPDILAVNASGPSATDGTEFVANMINDSMWGVNQMILNHAGLSPNGVLESDSASQIKGALQRGFGAPPGVVTQWHLDDDPGTSGHRCLLLNGQGVLIASYPDLDAACYVGDANNAAVAAPPFVGGYYRASDAAGTTPDILGPYLILPETRGYAPRGLDAAATVDPDGASRYLGDNQLDAFQGHLKDIGTLPASVDQVWVRSDATGPAATGTTFGGAATTPTAAARFVTKNFHTDGVNGTPRIDSESRMTNFSTKFVVWY